MSAVAPIAAELLRYGKRRRGSMLKKDFRSQSEEEPLKDGGCPLVHG